MRQSSLAFIILATLLSAVNATVALINDSKLPNNPTLAPLFAGEAYERQTADAESLLATGRKLPLACADFVDLELIPGVSDALASRILSARASLSSNRTKHSFRAADVLTTIHGIGEKTALELSRFIDIDKQCPLDP